MPPRTSPYLLRVELRNLDEADPEAYPFAIPAVRALEQIEFHPEVTFFVGDNASGKSTVLEGIALALGFGPEGGTKNVQFKTAETVSTLHEHLRCVRRFPTPTDYYFLRAESFFNIATYQDAVRYTGSYGGKSLHRQSHGESFLAVLLKKLQGDGLYLFDEPEAALSPRGLLIALGAINSLVQTGSQFLIATHSPILLAYPGAKIFEFSQDGIREVAYEETEHFMLTKDFLNNHKKRVQQLFAGLNDDAAEE